MIFFDNLEFTITLSSTLLTAALGFFVWFHSKRSATNLIFLGLCLNIAWWGLLNYLGFYGPQQFVLLFVRISLAFAVPNSVLFFIFVHTFPSVHLQMSRFSLNLILLVTFFVSFLSLTPLTIPFVERIDGRLVAPDLGIGMFLFVVLVIGGFIAGTYVMLTRYKSAQSPLERRQWQFIIAAFAIMFILMIVFVVLANAIFHTTRFIPVAPVFVLPFVLLTSYAVVRHGLLNIKLVATEIITTMVIVALLVQGLTAKTTFDILSQFLFAIFIAILGILLVRSVRKEIRQREEVARLAKKLKKANIQLKELDELKTEFMSIASHQLRSPLSVIKGYVSLIQDGAYGHVNKKLDKVLDNMYVSNEHLVRLVDEFLNISRMEQGRLKYNFAAFEIVPLVKESLKELKLRAKAKGLKLNFEDKLRDIKEIVADKEKMHHVVYNFIDNAIKYTEDGSIVVSLEQEGNGVTYRVKDTGYGFGPEDQANFFQKFYRGRNVKGINIGGTGLGLYVCRKFIEAHHGKIWAKSPGPGKGAEFGFWLPENQPQG